MMIRHHLSDQLLIAYATGNLSEAFSLVAATHVSLCDECRSRLEAFEAVGGALIEAETELLSEGSLDRVMAKLGRRDAATVVSRRGSFPTPLVAYVGGGPDAVKWRNLGMGIKQAILATSRTASARLLYIPAGQAVPDHGHGGIELTLVLEGAFHDATDRFGPGDFEIADRTLQHTPTAEPGDPCICLAATDAPLRFTSLLPRLLQPIFRI